MNHLMWFKFQAACANVLMGREVFDASAQKTPIQKGVLTVYISFQNSTIKHVLTVSREQQLCILMFQWCLIFLVLSICSFYSTVLCWLYTQTAEVTIKIRFFFFAIKNLINICFSDIRNFHLQHMEKQYKLEQMKMLSELFRFRFQFSVFHL